MKYNAEQVTFMLAERRQKMIYKTIDEWIEHNPNHIGALPIEVCHQIWGTKGKGTIMTKEALKLALEALEADELDMVDDGSGNMVFRKEQAITAIKEALAQLEQEPVKDWIASHNEICALLRQAHDALALTSYPQLRTWVGLTEEDLKLLSVEWRIVYGAWVDDFARAIEAKLKEKNNV
jgi:hypothetical protein